LENAGKLSVYLAVAVPFKPVDTLPVGE